MSKELVKPQKPEGGVKKEPVKRHDEMHDAAMAALDKIADLIGRCLNDVLSKYTHGGSGAGDKRKRQLERRNEEEEAEDVERDAADAEAEEKEERAQAGGALA